MAVPQFLPFPFIDKLQPGSFFTQQNDLMNKLIENSNYVNANLGGVIYPTIPANAVNLLGVTVGATGTGVTLTVNGSSPDTNASITLTGRGTGNTHLGSSTSLTNVVGALTASGGAVALSPANANVVISPTGTGVVTIAPATAGSLNNVIIGGTTPLAITGTRITATAGIAATGAVTGNIPSSFILHQASATISRLDSYGPDNATGGTIQFRTLTANASTVNIWLSVAASGACTFLSTLTVPGAANPLLTTSSAITSGAAAAVGTLNNAPAAGDPTKWAPFNDNGTTRYVPMW